MQKRSCCDWVLLIRFFPKQHKQVCENVWKQNVSSAMLYNASMYHFISHCRNIQHQNAKWNQFVEVRELGGIDKTDKSYFEVSWWKKWVKRWDAWTNTWNLCEAMENKNCETINIGGTVRLTKKQSCVILDPRPCANRNHVAGDAQTRLVFVCICLAELSSKAAYNWKYVPHIWIWIWIWIRIAMVSIQ